MPVGSLFKYNIIAGSTSQRVFIYVQNSTGTAGLTGLTNASGGLICYRARMDDGNAGGTQLTLAAGTRGTWSSGGFVEKDATNMPGVYELGLDNAGLATGSAQVLYHLSGATNMVPVEVEINLLNTTITSNVKQNAALSGFTFVMTSSSTHQPVTGLTVTATRSLGGAAFAACANAVTEVATGTYTINLAAADLNAAVVMLRFTAVNADDLNVQIITQP